MEFLPSKDRPSGPIESVRVNWYYRPRDILRKVTDSRLVFASMHSDICPLPSLRGKCQVCHLSEIKNLTDYRKTRDCFWYDKMFDRYIHRYYDVIPTSKVINVPSNVKRVLDERWKFVLVEVGKRKELTGAVKTCKKCGLYAAKYVLIFVFASTILSITTPALLLTLTPSPFESVNSVDCAVCNYTYHMSCVRPALNRKPARGFAWACAACSRAQERKLEARNTPTHGGSQAEAEEEVPEEDEEEPNGLANGTAEGTTAPVEDEFLPMPATAEQTAQARMWPYRYLGIHCRVEDVLDYDDRIYPRASSRLGTRHQAVVSPWFGHPVEYAKPPHVNRKYLKPGNRKDSKLPKETQAAIEAAKRELASRPKWVLDEPPGFVRRGEDEPVMVNGIPTRTSELLFKMPSASQIPARGESDAPGLHLSAEDREKFVDGYMNRAKELATEKGVEKYSTNFLDKALQLLYSENYDVEAALVKLGQVDKYTDLKEPHLRPEEVKLFEQGVSKYGSELRLVTKHVGTVPHYQIVRFYYMWKKSPRGRQIWGNYGGRRGKKEARRDSQSSRFADDVADDQDDSAFDNDKITQKKRGFACKFCSTRTSRQWRRAPGVQGNTTTSAEPSSKKDKGPPLSVALCWRCALLWRKYGIQWENVDDVAKKISQSSHKSWRRRADEELLVQLLVSTETPISINNATAAWASTLGVTVNANAQFQQEPPKKKVKGNDRERDSVATTPAPVEPAPKKKTVAEKAPEPPPIVPDSPKARTLPCAICNKIEPLGDQHLSCRDCRLTVHRACYGVSPSRNCGKWLCDMCSNDRNPTISTQYECVLCPVTWTEHELMEAPRVSHKKKSDREREKERLEKEMVAEAIKLYRQRQEAVGKPVGPREPLKRTAGNNWVHVVCALWMPEIRFGNAYELEPAEGFGLIPAEKYREVCKVCKLRDRGACVSCHCSGCNASFHIGCAFQAHYKFGFEITPVKHSRRDAANVVKVGNEVGNALPVIWCPHHAMPAAIHEMSEPAGKDGLNALQAFARTCKQADLTLPGTVRKAAHVQHSVGASQHSTAASIGSRRSSAVNGVGSSHLKDGLRNTRNSAEVTMGPVTVGPEGHTYTHSLTEIESDRKCYRCCTPFSPRWWPIENTRGALTARNGTPLMNGVAAKETFRPGPSNASPSFPTQSVSQNSFADYHPFDRNGGSNSDDNSVPYECHKCHLKGMAAHVSPETEPSPYQIQRPVLPAPAPRLSDYQSHSHGSHAHPAPPAAAGLFPRFVGPAPPSNGPPEWFAGYDQRPGDYGDGIPAYHAGLGPGPHHINGYQPPHPARAPHYTSGPPPPTLAPLAPQQYAAHQSPYAPVPMASPRLAPGPRVQNPFAASVSPPNMHATMVQHSPPFSISRPNVSEPPLARAYPGNRILSAPTPSPSVSQAPIGVGGLRTPGTPEDAVMGVASRPVSSGRFGSVNGTGSNASGASASPSLKNLLS